MRRFPAVALQWFQALLGDCDAPRHGVDLFGRDALLLGRLLATLGRFVAAAAPAPVTAELAAATIEMLRMPQVTLHPPPRPPPTTTLQSFQFQLPGRPGRQTVRLSTVIPWMRHLRCYRPMTL